MTRFPVLLLFIALTGTIKHFGQGTEFYKEEITFAIRDNFLYVNGIYFLKSDKSLEIPLIYPFPSDSLYGPVDSIIIINQTTNQAIENWRTMKSGIVFSLHLDSLLSTELWISYRQQLKGRQAEYILLSTKAWQKPLSEANYRLLVPIDLKILQFSIQPDTMTIHGDTKLYYWRMKKYFPDRNMIFTF
ncbi:MAG: hypothetical protein JXA23_11255 [Bacteroidales bacterium]|nr:hypothetical protein [Bacteroidales bacterium]